MQRRLRSETFLVPVSLHISVREELEWNGIKRQYLVPSMRMRGLAISCRICSTTPSLLQSHSTASCRSSSCVEPLQSHDQHVIHASTTHPPYSGFPRSCKQYCTCAVLERSKETAGNDRFSSCNILENRHTYPSVHVTSFSCPSSCAHVH